MTNKSRGVKVPPTLVYLILRFFWTNDPTLLTSVGSDPSLMKKFAINTALLLIAALAQVHGQSPNDNTPPDALVDRLGNVLVRPSSRLGEHTRKDGASLQLPTFAFVPGHYYTSNYFSRVITEYDPSGIAVGSYTVPSALGEEVRGLAFGADGLLYATVSRGSSGFAVLALESDGTVVTSYEAPVYTAGNLSFGKIAMDSQYLYVCGQNVLTRFLLGNPSSGTTIYTENQIYDVKPLPDGHLFVAWAYGVDEITNSGAFVRRIQLTGGQSFTDIRGIEYNPATNILFVTHLGHTDFFTRIMRVNATTGALLSNTEFYYADDLFIDSSGNLLVGSRFEDPTFYSQDLVPGSSLGGGQQMFVTQYASAEATPAQALNISTRLRVEIGDRVMIGGFIVTGSAPKKVAVRGIGPSLAGFGLSDFLADPVLELRDGSGALLDQNDNWQDDPTQAAQLTALGLAPGNPNESAMVATLQPFVSYTATLSGKNSGTGIGLVEIYDADQTADSHLANISTRGFVQTGDNVMIGGFILGGDNGTAIAVRGIGPSLTQARLSDVLADPVLELRDSNGALLTSNDDWQDDPAQGALSVHGLAPANSLESGIFAPLPPGAYTAILAGKNGGSGIGLLEIYNVP
jgi:hypothetical protein